MDWLRALSIVRKRAQGKPVTQTDPSNASHSSLEPAYLGSLTAPSIPASERDIHQHILPFPHLQTGGHLPPSQPTRSVRHAPATLQPRVQRETSCIARLRSTLPFHERKVPSVAIATHAISLYWFPWTVGIGDASVIGADSSEPVQDNGREALVGRAR